MEDECSHHLHNAAAQAFPSWKEKSTGPAVVMSFIREMETEEQYFDVVCVRPHHGQKQNLTVTGSLAIRSGTG